MINDPGQTARAHEQISRRIDKIAAIVPVTPVTLACAAIQSFDADFIRHDQLVGRMGEMNEVLRELNSRVIQREGGVEETFDRAWRMLNLRYCRRAAMSKPTAAPFTAPLPSNGRTGVTSTLTR